MLTGGGNNWVTPTVLDGTTTSPGYIQFQSGDYLPANNHYVTICYNNSNAD